MNNQMKDVGGSVAERLVKSAVRLVIRKPRVQVPPWPLAGFVLDSPEIRSLTTIVNSQLVYLRPVGIRNPVMFADYVWIICFSHLPGPTCVSALNTAEGK